MVNINKVIVRVNRIILFCVMNLKKKYLIKVSLLLYIYYIKGMIFVIFMIDFIYEIIKNIWFRLYDL